MASRSGRIGWYDPDPRAILPLPTFHVPRRLARTVRNGSFEVRVDTCFTNVMRACATVPRGKHSGSWISEELIEAYTALHQLGLAHSVETWQQNQLVGGLYGVAIRGLFAGESMFSLETDASKVALVHLVERLRAGNFQLLDTQFLTSHLARFGAIEIPRSDYQIRLSRALLVDAVF